jgi:predicted NBD/HSP70 family sugar kinase
VRRIEALTGPEGVALMRRHDALLDEAARLLRKRPEEVPSAVADALAKAVGGVLAAAVALADPVVVLVGGLWGRGVLAALAREFAQAPRHVPVEAAAVDDEPALAGARETALQQLRHAVVAAAPGQSGFESRPG